MQHSLNTLMTSGAVVSRNQPRSFLPLAVARGQTLPFTAYVREQPKLAWTSPAITVFESLQDSNMVLLHPDELLIACERALNAHHARYGVVVSQGHLQGLLPGHFIHGQRAIQCAHDLQVAHGQLQVGEVMLPIAALPIVAMRQLANKQIGDVVATLQQSNSDFLLVRDEQGLVGVIAALNIVAKTGESVQIRQHAAAFSQLVYARHHPDSID